MLIEVYQQDWIPGFAAFKAGSLRNDAKAVIGLNIGSLMAAVECGDVPRSDVPYIVAETIMHEVVHALEEWAEVEFSEERVEAILERYREKYSGAKG